MRLWVGIGEFDMCFQLSHSRTRGGEETALSMNSRLQLDVPYQDVVANFARFLLIRPVLVDQMLNGRLCGVSQQRSGKRYGRLAFMADKFFSLLPVA